MNKAKIFFSGLKKGFADFSHMIPSAVNFVLLLFIYTIGVGMISAFGKLFGKRYIDLKKKGSTWIKRKNQKMAIGKFYRQF